MAARKARHPGGQQQVVRTCTLVWREQANSWRERVLEVAACRKLLKTGPRIAESAGAEVRGQLTSVLNSGNCATSFVLSSSTSEYRQVIALHDRRSPQPTQPSPSFIDKSNGDKAAGECEGSVGPTCSTNSPNLGAADRGQRARLRGGGWAISVLGRSLCWPAGRR